MLVVLRYVWRIFWFVGLFIVLSACSKNTSENLPITVLKTQYGDIHIEVDVQRAPISGQNFIAYIEGKYFDNASFYRTVNRQNDNHPLKIAVLQGGINASFDESFEPAFAPIEHESTKITGLAHSRGAVSFARGDLGTAQTEFFISTEDNPHLDFGGKRHPDEQGFAVFGKVVKGMEVVDKIAALPANGAYPDPYVKNQILNSPVVISNFTLKK